MVFFYQRFINLNYRVENSHAITDADEWEPAIQKAPNSQIRDRMYKIQENLENTGLQLPVDKFQSLFALI